MAVNPNLAKKFEAQRQRAQQIKQQAKNIQLAQAQRQAQLKLIDKLTTWQKDIQDILNETKNNPKGVLRDRVIGRSKAIDLVSKQLSNPKTDFNSLLQKADKLRLEETKKARKSRNISLKKLQQEQLRRAKSIQEVLFIAQEIAKKNKKLPEGAIASAKGGGYIYSEGKIPATALKPKTTEQFIKSIGIVKPKPGLRLTKKQIEDFLINSSKEDLARQLQQSNFSPTQTPKQALEQRKLISAQGGQVTLSTVRNVFVSDESVSAYNKVKTGNVTEITGREATGVILDLAGATPPGRAIKIFISGVKGAKAAFTGVKITSVPKLRNSLTFARSVASDTGFANRMYQSAQKYYDVDNNLLKNVGDKTGIGSSEAVYRDYLSTIQNEFGDKKFKFEDLANFFGVDTASKQSIIKAQAKYEKFLLSQGYSKAQATKIISNLEAKRRSRLFGQVLGAIKIEVSSERLAAKALARGSTKKKAVSLATAREFSAVLASEAYVQENNILPSDMYGALLLGATFVGGQYASQFFSAQKFKKLTNKDIDSGLNKLSNKFNNKISDKKQITYANKLLSKQGVKLTPSDMKKQFTKKEIKDLSQNYIKNSLAKNRNKKVYSKSERLLLRDPIANILDPAEYPGDVIYDLTQKLKKKVLKIKSKPKKKVKVKTKVAVASKTKVTTKAKAKAKVTAKAKAKTKVKAKAKTKVKTKAKAKTKVKAKAKTKVKAKAKTKAKAKAKAKTKVKAKTILVPSIKKPKPTKKASKINVYIVEYKQGSRKVQSRQEYPLNKALRRAKSLNKKEVSIIRSGKKVIKDIKRPSLSNFKVKRLTNKLKLIKK